MFMVFARAGGSPIFCSVFNVYWCCGDTGSPRIKDTDRRGSNRVNRGGGWNNNFNNSRSANRNNNTPTNTNNNIGFRLSSSSRRQIADVYGCARRVPVMTRPVSCSGVSGQVVQGPGSLVGFAERPPAPLRQRRKAE
ncbi:MAG: hypothetical protein BWX80_00254 [Candidatus Hydrogenedentes bacterium ADurb.Bin101]|jgi:hypothetical protein|nr:MAG: hypothetical protein BWX80_00254 [Candidatus Hydrogenedentes bacterium ADurb.Bin101]HOC67857.1 hypothetical protein [Candidatus Hydrogenedentota bacterium]